jgi:hypothetical protein
VANCATYIVTYNGQNTFSLAACDASDQCVDWTIGQFGCTLNNPSQPVFATAQSFIFDLYCPAA